jgi:hypothetical protein
MKLHRGVDASLQNFRAAPASGVVCDLNMPSDENGRFEKTLMKNTIFDEG